MDVMIDTCALLPAFHRGALQHSLARQAWRHLTSAGDVIVVSPQVIAEFWNVCTRPSKYNGYGLAPDRARRLVNAICRLCRVEYESESSFAKWRELAFLYQIKGVSVHDARIAAIMIDRRIRQILTFDETGFRRYEPDGINVLTPAGVLTP